MILTEIIFEYLQTNRRITVPALGTFLSKGDNSPLLFSEFMKSDDGILRELLASKAKMSELEAAIFVDRFVFDLRHAIESNERFTLPHLGYMTSEDGRTYIFEYDPEARDEQAVESVDEVPSDTPAEEQNSSATEIDEQQPQEATTSDEPAQDEPSDDRTVAEIFQAAGSEEPTTDEPPTKRRGGGVDWWIIIAILATLFAIGVVLYGIFVEWMLGNVSFGADIDAILESLLDTVESFKS